MSTEAARRGLAVAAIAALFVTSGCSDEPQDSVDLPEADPAAGSATSSSPGLASDEASTSAEPGGVPEPSPPPRNGDKVADAQARVYALKLPKNEPAHSAAQALVDYLDFRSRSFSKAEVDLAELSALAMGDAMNAVQSYNDELDKKNHHVAGDIWFRLPGKSVTVKGNRAKVAAPACVLNANSEVNAENIAVESPASAYGITAKLLKAGPKTWVVTEFSGEATADC